MKEDSGPQKHRDPVGLFEEEAAWVAYENNPHLDQRTRIVQAMIPRDARTVLDVGCGTGILVRALKPDRIAIGIDPSRLALTRFDALRICARGETLPLRRGSVDLACCLEVLEHLDDDALGACAQELSRVTRRWVLLATPDSEDPRRNAIRCPRCGETFNRSHHLQTFDDGRLARLFPGFTVRDVRRGGQPVRPYPYPLLWLRHHIARRYYKGPGETKGLCPRCGNREFPRFRPNILSVVLDGANKLFSRRRPYWVLVLLERPQGAGAAADGPR